MIILVVFYYCIQLKTHVTRDRESEVEDRNCFCVRLNGFFTLCSEMRVTTSSVPTHNKYDLRLVRASE